MADEGIMSSLWGRLLVVTALDVAFAMLAQSLLGHNDFGGVAVLWTAVFAVAGGVGYGALAIGLSAIVLIASRARPGRGVVPAIVTGMTAISFLTWGSSRI